MKAYLAIVERGRAGIYETLKEHFETDARQDIRVLWDRRHEDRRAGAERRRLLDREPHPDRRQGERRRRPPTTWSNLGFVLVGDRGSGSH